MTERDHGTSTNIAEEHEEAPHFIALLIRLYRSLLEVLAPLIPLGAIFYLRAVGTATLPAYSAPVHEAVIVVACLLSAFTAITTFLCYRSSGESFLRWLVLGFAGFTVLYLFHGLLTRLAGSASQLFLAFGSASRLFLVVCMGIAVGAYSRQQVPEPKAPGSFGMIGAGAILILVLSVGLSSSWDPELTRTLIRATETLNLVAFVGLALFMLWRRFGNPLMRAYIMSLVIYAQASLAFLWSTPWEHMWWLAHGIFAVGFLILSYSIIRSYHTTRSFSNFYSQEELMDALRTEKKHTEQALHDLEEANRQLTEMASIDGLTGVLNHRTWNEKAEVEFERARRYHEPMSLIAIDFDAFKEINDTHGHQIGDEVLQQVSKRLSGHLRLHDLLGRIGGDEFIVLLPQTSTSRAVEVGERLRETVTGTPLRMSNGVEFAIRLSVGIGSLEDSGASLADIRYHADQRLYQAKREGGNCVVGGVIQDP